MSSTTIELFMYLKYLVKEERKKTNEWMLGREGGRHSQGGGGT